LNPFFAIAISLTCQKRNAAQGLMSSQWTDWRRIHNQNIITP